MGFEGAGGFAHCHWCGDDACEAAIQEETKVTIRFWVLAVIFALLSLATLKLR